MTTTTTATLALLVDGLLLGLTPIPLVEQQLQRPDVLPMVPVVIMEEVEGGMERHPE